jgi:hypothetical protein
MMILARMITARDEMFRRHKQEGNGRAHRIAKGTELANYEIRCASCNAINRIGSYRIDRIPWCGKCRAALPEATSRRAIRRLYQYRRYYWIAAVLGMVSIVIWQAPTKETTPAYLKQTEPLAWNCVAVSRPRTGIYRNYDLSAKLAAPFEIRTAVGANYFVKLEDSVTREPVQTFFIRSGQTMQSDVPFGQFVLKYATGRSWCGEIDMFGPETDLHKADGVLRFARQDSDDGYTITGHTIELVVQVNGNLKISKFAARRFDAGLLRQT